jgi:hypothetical protein
MQYPKWKYKNGKSCVVNDANAEAALGDGWYDTPGALKEAKIREKEARLAALEAERRAEMEPKEVAEPEEAEEPEEEKAVEQAEPEISEEKVAEEVIPEEKAEEPAE